MKRIDLLPPEARVKASRERGLLYAILILVAVVVALGLVYMQQNSKVSSKQTEVRTLTSEASVEQQKAAALAPYAEIQSTRVAMTATANGIYQAGVPWSIILQEISLVIPENVRLETMNCTVPSAMVPGGAAAVAGGAVVPADVTFIGTTYIHKDVAEFMTGLGLVPQLSDIQLVSSVPILPPVPTPVRFTVTAKLRPYLVPPPTTTLQGATP